MLQMITPGTRRALAVAYALVAIGCAGDGKNSQGDNAGAGDRSSRAGASPARYNLGRAADPAQLAMIDIDANPAGVGLPPGHGSWTEGKAVYAGKCAMCHGVNGEGAGPFPKLIGAEPRDSFPFAHDVKIPHTIGNYWPYATTVYDYIHRAMPFNAPGSLKSDEVYSVVAYLLAENQVIARDAVLDATTLPKVKMPARDHFVLDNRRGGPTFR